MNSKKIAFVVMILISMTRINIKAQTVKDIDSNEYNTVIIGKQVWFKENLKTTKFNDGTPIPMVADSSKWANQTTPAYCWYMNVETPNKKEYGALYNWYTVEKGKLCPVGWHVPSESEWIQLINLAGGDSEAGGKLRETGTTHWQSEHPKAKNKYNFTAIPGGYRYNGFGLKGMSGFWWTSTERSTTKANSRSIFFYYIIVSKSDYTKDVGMSVRCIKD